MAKRSQGRWYGLARSRGGALCLGLIVSVVLAEIVAYAYICWSGTLVPAADDSELPGSFTDYSASYVETYTLVEKGRRLVCGDAPEGEAYRLAIIGDSFGFGAGVSDCQDFPSLVNRSLPQVEVMNASRPAAGFEGYLTVADEEVCGQGFDGILLLVCGNDFGESSEEPLREIARYSNLASLVFARVSRLPTNHLASKLFRSVGLLSPPPPGTPLNIPPQYRTEQIPGTDRRAMVGILEDLAKSREIAVYMSNPPAELAARNRVRLEELVDRALECSDDVWVAVVPNGAAYSSKQRQYISSWGGHLPPEGEAGQVVEIVRQVTLEKGARFIETDTAFAPEADSAYYVRDVHWTSRGHQIMARQLVEALDVKLGGRLNQTEHENPGLSP